MTALGLLVRWVHLASGITLVGTFLLLLLAGRPPKPTAARWEADALGLARAAALLALIAGLGALAIQTVVLEGRSAALLEATALARVLGATRFGTVWIFRHGLLLLLAAFLLVRLPIRTAADRTALCAQGLLLGAIALGAAAWAGHAAAAEPSPLRASAADALHLAGAGAWLGGLAPLAWLLRRAARPEHADARPYAVLAARRFSRLALAAVLALVATGVLNAWSQVGSVAALLGTPYGRLLVLKLLLLAPILALAAVNRLPSRSAVCSGVTVTSTSALAPGRMSMRSPRRRFSDAEENNKGGEFPRRPAAGRNFERFSVEHHRVAGRARGADHPQRRPDERALVDLVVHERLGVHVLQVPDAPAGHHLGVAMHGVVGPHLARGLSVVGGGVAHGQRDVTRGHVLAGADAEARLALPEEVARRLPLF